MHDVRYEHPVIEPVATLNPYRRNARIHDMPALLESFREHGQYLPITVNRGTLTGRPREIVAGHGRLKAAQHLGWDEVGVNWVDVVEDEYPKLVEVDNRTSDLATFDLRQLVENLSDMDDLIGSAYDQSALDHLVNELQKQDADEDDPDDIRDADEVPDTKAETVSVAGDLWLCGPHRVMCGDSTKPDVLAAALGGTPADMIWTDPPYGISYVGKTKKALTIRNDGEAGLAPLLRAAFTAWAEVVPGGRPVYIAAPPGPLLATFMVEFTAAGHDLRQILTWVKNTMVLGRSDYHYRHEAILYGFTAGAAEGRRGRGGKAWFGENNATTVFEVAKPAASEQHPTMKPVDLIAPMLRNSCPPKRGVVLDPFGGSGSTMAAANVAGRRAVLVELDPVYVDVICRRWERLTGEPATRPDGEPFPRENTGAVM